MAERPRVCVIGAGPSGITAAKALRQRGFDFDVYEKSDRVGGNWVFGNPNGMSACYETLHIDSSKKRTQFSDFPMPDSFPDFPHHTHIREYFDSYAERFGILDHIRFETAVERAERGADGVWTITTDRGDSERYDALLVCNGHHWNPRWPEPAFPGADTFTGEQMHSHAYTGPEQLAGRDVVVLGIGNSAVDIAVDASYAARSTILCSRRGAHVIPKYIFGKPMDQLGSSAKVPFKVRQQVIKRLLKAYQGEMDRYGLPRPDHEFGEAHPTVSGRLLDRLAHGEITYRPNIDHFAGDEVHFVDGTSARADLVVFCTGYKVTFPFFAPDFISAPDNDLPLFRRVFHPEIDNVFFIGLLQPLGSIIPAAELQALWVTEHLDGRYHLPPAADLRADIAAERERMFKRYVASKRHTMQVDFEDYVADVGKERRKGAERARARGFALPVAPRAERVGA